jgi:hypothetical protein
MSRARALAAGVVAVGILCGSGCKRETVSLVPADYRSWQLSTQRELNYPIPGHLNNYRIIHVNATGLRYTVTTENGRRTVTYPTGTTLVKEIYSGLDDPPEGALPASIVAMVKNPADHRAIRGWVYLLKNPRTGEEQVVTESLCADCHAAASDRHPYGGGNPGGESRDCVFITPELKQ